MKKFILISLSVLMFSACIAPDKNDTKVEVRESLKRMDTFPNGAIAYNQIDWEQVLVDTSGKHAYLGINAKGQGQWMTKDSTWKKAVVIPRNVYWLTMSRKLVKHFMAVTDYFTKDLLIGLLLLIIFAFIVHLFIKGDWMRFAGKGGALMLGIVCYLGVGIRIIQKRPSELADLNVKQLSKAEFEHWQKIDPTFEKFWKAKWENNELTSLSNR